MSRESDRLREPHGEHLGWQRWGPYVSERAWATVREDYSADGDAWTYLPHDLARSKAYRWGEDGIAAICDRYQLLVFAPAFWNGVDPILKERFFGLTSHEGNHGEDVKEYYYYLDNTPTHSYMKYLYKYPQRAFPYARLVEENARRSSSDPEYELLDTGIFDEDRYFDIIIEYAKGGTEDIAVRIEAINRGPDPARRSTSCPTSGSGTSGAIGRAACSGPRSSARAPTASIRDGSNPTTRRSPTGRPSPARIISAPGDSPFPRADASFSRRMRRTPPGRRALAARRKVDSSRMPSIVM